MKFNDDKTILMRIQLKDIDEEGSFRVPDGVIALSEEAVARGKARFKLKRIDINGVKSIDGRAFSGCINLETVIGSPETIGFDTFANCRSLKHFDFSNTKEIGVRAFMESGLVEINLCKLETVPGYAFYGCINLEKVTGSPVCIRGGAFKNCHNLKTVDLSKTTTLVSEAFRNCGLTEVDISNLEEIPKFAFIDCKNLKTVVGSPKIIYTNAFCRCPQLKSFDFSKLEEIEYHAFFESELSECVLEMGRLVNIRFGDYEASFARKATHFMAYKISRIIDPNKNTYLDLNGIPFILDDTGNPIRLTEDRNRFIDLWSS